MPPTPRPAAASERVLYDIIDTRRGELVGTHEDLQVAHDEASRLNREARADLQDHFTRARQRRDDLRAGHIAPRDPTGNTTGTEVAELDATLDSIGRELKAVASAAGIHDVVPRTITATDDPKDGLPMLHGPVVSDGNITLDTLERG